MDIESWQFGLTINIITIIIILIVFLWVTRKVDSGMEKMSTKTDYGPGYSTGEESFTTLSEKDISERAWKRGRDTV